MPSPRQGSTILKKTVGAEALPPLNLDHLERLGAAGGDDLDRVALFLSNQGTGERRGDRNALLLGVGLGLADDLPYPLLVGVLVDHRHGRAERDGLPRE